MVRPIAGAPADAPAPPFPTEGAEPAEAIKPIPPRPKPELVTVGLSELVTVRFHITEALWYIKSFNAQQHLNDALLGLTALIGDSQS